MMPQTTGAVVYHFPGTAANPPADAEKAMNNRSETIRTQDKKTKHHETPAPPEHKEYVDWNTAAAKRGPNKKISNFTDYQL